MSTDTAMIKEASVEHSSITTPCLIFGLKNCFVMAANVRAFTLLEGGFVRPPGW